MEMPSDPGYLSADRSGGLRSFCIVMAVMSVLSIVLRFLSRGMALPQTVHQGRFLLDDWLALAAVPWILAQLGVSLAVLHYGFGRHLLTLPMDNLLRIAKNQFIIYFLYDAGLFFTKASALCFLKRIFPSRVSPTWFNISVWAAHGMNIAWLIGIFFGTLFMCNPIAKNWNTTLPGHCGSTSDLFIGSAVPSVVIDLFILILPLPRLWGLQTGWGRKIGITTVFVFGYCVVIVSLGRVVTVLKSTVALDTDITYEGVPVVYWVTAEPAVSLMGVCLPAMLPLGRYLMTTYLTPITSLVSLLVSTRGTRDAKTPAGSGDFPDNAVGYQGSDNRQTKASTRFTSTSHTEIGHGLQRLPSVDSQRSILRLRPSDEHFSNQVNIGLGQRNGVPVDAIRVDNDVKVTDATNNWRE